MTIQAWQIVDMELPQLFEIGDSYQEEDCYKKIKIAILGDCATQHYSRAFASALKINNIWPDIYEAEYDSIVLETVNHQSGLFQYQPDYVIIFNCIQQLEKKYAHSSDNFAEKIFDEIISVWDRLFEKGCTKIIQHNFPIPLTRSFGNHTTLCSNSLAYQSAKINASISNAVKSRQGIKIIDTEYLSSAYGKNEWFDERYWTQFKQSLSPKFLPPLVKNITDLILASLGYGIKCVVLDLDNTLWGGVLSDVGLEGLELGENGLGQVYCRFQQELLNLKKRGILLAVCSKNRLSDVMRVFQDHPDMILKEDDIVVFEVNYESKADNMIKIQEHLGIGLDSFLFLDDSPFERDLVRSSLPEIQVPNFPEDPGEYLSSVMRWNFFEAVELTQEDQDRTEMYRSNFKRSTLKKEYPDLESYLGGLSMTATVLRFENFSLPRIFQLTQKSNQFNLMTIRYSELELENIAQNKKYLSFSIHLRDRLGDNGIVVIVVVRLEGDKISIENWIMSCRVLGRKVELFTINTLIDYAKLKGYKKILGQYRRSNKNSMVSDLYTRLGFSEEKIVDDVTFFELGLSKSKKFEAPITETDNNILGEKNES